MISADYGMVHVFPGGPRGGDLGFFVQLGNCCPISPQVQHNQQVHHSRRWLCAPFPGFSELFCIVWSFRRLLWNIYIATSSWKVSCDHRLVRTSDSDFILSVLSGIPDLKAYLNGVHVTGLLVRICFPFLVVLYMI